MVETSTGRILRTEVHHKLIVPKTPKQNGVAEEMNRTLVESVRSMLVDAKLRHKFWAEALSTAVLHTESKHKGSCTRCNQEHIEPRSGEGACNSACYPCIWRNSKMADVFKLEKIMTYTT